MSSIQTHKTRGQEAGEEVQEGGRPRLPRCTAQGCPRPGGAAQRAGLLPRNFSPFGAVGFRHGADGRAVLSILRSHPRPPGDCGSRVLSPSPCPLCWGTGSQVGAFPLWWQVTPEAACVDVHIGAGRTGGASCL